MRAFIWNPDETLNFSVYLVRATTGDQAVSKKTESFNFAGHIQYNTKELFSPQTFRNFFIPLSQSKSTISNNTIQYLQGVAKFFQKA